MGPAAWAHPCIGSTAAQGMSGQRREATIARYRRCPVQPHWRRFAGCWPRVGSRGDGVRVSGWRLAGVGLVVVAGSVALGMSLRRPIASAISQPVRLAVPPPPDTQFANDVERIAYALSPDGSQLGFVTDKQGATRIWMRPLSSDTARPIAGTEGARSFMWSPNGNAIAFFAGDKLKRIDLGGGVPVVVCDAPSGVGIYGSWSANDEIVFASIEGDAIYKVSATGGTPTPIVKPDLSRGESRVVWPSFLPDGQRFVFVTRFTEGPGQLSVGGDGRAPRHIAPLLSPAQWVDPHYLVFAKEGTLVAQRFDTDTERLVGQPVPIADSVEHSVATYKAGFSASRNGHLVYQPSFDVDHVAWVDRTGAEAATVGTPGFYQSLRLSRDRTRLMFDRVDPRVGTHDIWILDLQRGTEDRITSGALVRSLAPLDRCRARRRVHGRTRRAAQPVQKRPRERTGAATHSR